MLKVKGKMRIIAVRRDDRYSPNSVERDRAILQAVIDQLGTDIPMIDEAELTNDDDADMYLSMGRLPQTVSFLKRKEDEGAIVVNSGYGVEACTRGRLDAMMRAADIPMPPLQGDAGYWLKRGDASAQDKSDVVFCKDKADLDAAQEEFACRGITDVVVSTHVVGDLVKFYGVGADFFRCFYPCDDHIWKFGDECVNGKAHHYPFDMKELQNVSVRLSDMARTEVYGGDVIIDAQGHFSIIDFNDWPSFSRCRNDAAEAIATYIRKK